MTSLGFSCTYAGNYVRFGDYNIDLYVNRYGIFADREMTIRVYELDKYHPTASVDPSIELLWPPPPYSPLYYYRIAFDEYQRTRTN